MASSWIASFPWGDEWRSIAVVATDEADATDQVRQWIIKDELVSFGRGEYLRVSQIARFAVSPA